MKNIMGSCYIVLQLYVHVHVHVFKLHGFALRFLQLIDAIFG